jgi:hypothetical protein
MSDNHISAAIASRCRGVMTTRSWRLRPSKMGRPTVTAARAAALSVIDAVPPQRCVGEREAAG